MYVLPCAQVKLQGVPNIRKVFLRQTKSRVPDFTTGRGFSEVEEWVLDTEGVNLAEVRGQALNHFGTRA